MNSQVESIRTYTITLKTQDDSTTSAYVTEPSGDGPYPAIVLGAEATGVNSFIRTTAEKLSAAGYITITPDYYRGKGPSDPDNYTDFTEVHEAIANLDFRAATYDILSGADWLRTRPNVDSNRIIAWGYCTGGSLTMLAACLDRRLAATVQFYPSQPIFDPLTLKRPSQPIDLIWNIASPILIIYGADDYLVSGDLIKDMRSKFDQWYIPHQIKVYEGAGHAFCSPSNKLHCASAAADAWRLACDFLDKNLPAHTP